MNKALYLILTLFVCSVSSSQTSAQSLTKTSEYSDYGKKRRDTYLDNDMRVVKEDYYSNNDQKIILTIEYISEKKIGRVTGFDNSEKAFEVDYKKGTYEDFKKGISLKFTGNFQFDGIQKGEKIAVSYRNGLKDGRLVQADSAVTNHKVVAVQKVDVRYLRFDIIKFYADLETDPVFSVFNGLILNFKSGKLDGKQSSYFVDGKIKFDGSFNNDRLIKYTSFDKTNTIISKLETDNGITNKGQILNGQLLSPDDQYIFWFDKLSETGDIILDSNYRYPATLYENNNDHVQRTIDKFIKELKEVNEEHVPSKFEIKKKFDDLKCTFNDATVMRAILEIPLFYIKRFSFNNKEDASITSALLISNGTKIKELVGDTLELIDGYYFLKSPLPLYKYYTPEYFFYLQLPYSEKGIEYKRVEKNDDIEKMNHKFVKWITNTYSFSPSNFYLGVKPASYENYEQYYDSSSLNTFLRHIVSTTNDNIQALETKSNLIADPFRWQDSFYYYRYFYTWKTEPYLTLQTKNGSASIRIYDKHRVEAIMNTKKYLFEFDEQRFGEFKVVAAQIIDVNDEKIIYEYRPKDEKD
jgi:hypothetical protein